MQPGETVTHIGIGYGNGGVMTSKKRALVWGSSSWGQTGVGISTAINSATSAVIAKPIEIIIPGKKITSFRINGGYAPVVFFMFLTDGCDYPLPTLSKSYAVCPNAVSNQIYTMGYGNGYAAGDGTATLYIANPKLVPTPNKIFVDVQFGLNFYTALTNTGELYYWGTSPGLALASMFILYYT